MDTPGDELDRFVQAQQLDYARALAELKAGRKNTHWIWYVLPQLRELGRSELARAYGISGRAEAEAYLRHPVLGVRLVECVDAMLRHPPRGAEQILGSVDAMKFRSCLTLFAAVAPEPSVFATALAVFYDGIPDEATLNLLAQETGDV